MAKYYPKVKIAYGKTWVGNESGDAVEKSAALLPATWESGKVPTSTETEGVFEWGTGGGGGSTGLNPRMFNTIVVQSATQTAPPDAWTSNIGDLYYVTQGDLNTAWADFYRVIIECTAIDDNGIATWSVWTPTDNIGYLESGELV